MLRIEENTIKCYAFSLLNAIDFTLSLALSFLLTLLKADANNCFNVKSIVRKIEKIYSL